MVTLFQRKFQRVQCMTDFTLEKPNQLLQPSDLTQHQQSQIMMLVTDHIMTLDMM